MQDERDRKIADLERKVEMLQRMVETLLAENARLHAENAELRARLGQNSSNSGKPPSSDSPEDRRARQGQGATGRKRGGQPGHKGSSRVLLTPTKTPVDCFPMRCRRCDESLKRKDALDPLRHQTIGIPEIKPVVSEWRLHRILCPCGAVTCASLPPGVPRGAFDPGLVALVALLTGTYNLSRRKAAEFLSDVLNVEISLGAVSNLEETMSDALAQPAQQAQEHVCEQPIKNCDATSWAQSGKARTLWTIATACVTFFFITKDAKMPGLRGIFTRIKGILISDRGKQFGFWAMKDRQICWAHLIRKFVSFEEQGGTAADVARRLIFCSQSVIHYWHRVRDGTISRARFRRVMASMRLVIERHIEDGVQLGIRGVSGSCRDILLHREALWTFVDCEGVEPTNNHAERELRAFVLWRKRSFGSQSDRGCVFAARMMTVTHSLRKQKRHVLSFLTKACQAVLRGTVPPSLINTTP